MTSPAPASPLPPPPSATALHPDKTLLDAWLLLLLASGESYGWALVAQLRRRGLVVDPSLVYRHLRELEGDGAVTSRWTASAAGPRRRSYLLTPAGHGVLTERADDVAAEWNLHDDFVRTHTEAPPRDAAPAADGAARRPGRELQAAWVLLLLDHGASYGYELRHELEARELLIDSATLYRLLRRLEREGWLESHWTSPIAGPRRRLYCVTPVGRRHLGELAGVITSIRDTFGAFLRAHTEFTGGRTPERPDGVPFDGTPAAA